MSEQSSRPVHLDLSGMPAVALLLARYVALSADAWLGASVLAPCRWFLQLLGDATPFRLALMNSFL